MWRLRLLRLVWVPLLRERCARRVWELRRGTGRGARGVGTARGGGVRVRLVTNALWLLGSMCLVSTRWAHNHCDFKLPFTWLLHCGVTPACPRGAEWRRALTGHVHEHGG